MLAGSSPESTVGSSAENSDQEDFEDDDDSDIHTHAIHTVPKLKILFYSILKFY